MVRYIKRPIVIEAIRITESNIDEVKEFINNDDQVSMPFFDNISHPKEKPKLVMWHIHTLEGVMRADIGDWIIKGIKGEFYPCKNDIFEASYYLYEEV